MIKALKFILVFSLTLAVIAGIYYSFLDRFDVVASLLILINAGSFGLMEIFSQERERRIEEPLKRVFEPDNHMEFYDEGYLQGMEDLLKMRVEATPAPAPVLIENFTISINALPKVKAIGRFVVIELVDESYRVNFIKRYPDEC